MRGFIDYDGIAGHLVKADDAQAQRLLELVDKVHQHEKDMQMQDHTNNLALITAGGVALEKVVDKAVDVHRELTDTSNNGKPRPKGKGRGSKAVET